MQEIEAKRKLKASEGAHFFYSLIFLAASGLIENNYLTQTCSQNLPLLVHLVFYGLIIWGTYILITIVPRYNTTLIADIRIQQSRSSSISSISCSDSTC
jgi:hypothetical protein